MFYIYFFFTFFVILFIYKISLRFNFAIDSDFQKPQAIHSIKKPRILGMPICLIFLILIMFDDLDYNLKYIFFFSIICSIIGLFDDLGFKIKPVIRFLYQAIITFFIFYFSEIIDPVNNLDFLPSYFDNYYILFFFTIFSILTIANSFNFMDGCNGLVILYSLQVFLSLYFFSEYYLTYFILLISVYLIIILFFNFPLSRAFLGDFGAYFFGFLISFLLIYLSNNKQYINTDINEWFFAILLLYPSFEIFTTVVRRILNKKSPFYPDNLHLHSIIFSLLKLIINNSERSNYYTTTIIVVINSIIFLFLFICPVSLYKIVYFLGFFLLILIRYYLLNFLNKAKLD